MVPGTGNDNLMDSLLRTKLFIPTPRKDLVRRQRLIDLLQSELQHDGTFNRKITLIAAPAGYGKTTLACQWLIEADIPVAWLALESSENDPSTFLSYTVAALQAISPKIGISVQGILLVSCEVPMFLVLDDYHVIQSEPIHEILNFLLEHLPVNVHLVITSREDPPLALHRLQARRQILEVRQTELSFVEVEAVAFFRTISDVNLLPENAAALTRHTEGWVTGLQLAALSMKSTEDQQAFIDSFTGSNRYILDYLVEEVLHRQPQGSKTFLLQTSILERLCGPLCDAVRGGISDQRNGGESSRKPVHSDSQIILETLETANLFIVPLDNERRWYRYHQLFADLLQVRLLAEHPDLEPILHKRAAGWYENNQHFTPAINHYLKADDFEAVAQLIEDWYQAFIVRGDYVTLRRWIEALPQEIVSSRPRLSMAYAWSLLNETDADILDGPLNDAEQALATLPIEVQDESAALNGELLTLRSSQAFYRDDIEDAIKFSRGALERLSPEQRYVRGFAALNLANSLAVLGQIDEAIKAYEEIITECIQFDNLSAALIALGYQAELYAVHGNLNEAAHIHRRALQLATGPDGSVNPMGGIALVGLGMLHYEMDELDEAINFLEQGKQLCQQTGVMVMLAHSLSTLALASQAQGDVGRAQELLEEAEHLAPGLPQEGDFPRVQSAMIRLALALGELETAGRWVRQSGAKLEDEIKLRYAAIYPYISLARHLIAQGKDDPAGAHLRDAIDFLARLLTHAENAGRISQCIEILILQALALEAQGQLSEALIPLQQALQLADQAGHVRTFVDEGEPMEDLLKRLQLSFEAAPDLMDQKIRAYTIRLQSAFAGAKSQYASGMEGSQLVEPLSEHELRVLRLVAAGLTNREAADELYLSVNTVKWHLRNIYGKLNVRGRVEAIARAQELNLF
jgi:LuxR family maltose regulon positive regulatory protein